MPKDAQPTRVQFLSLLVYFSLRHTIDGKQNFRTQGRTINHERMVGAFGSIFDCPKGSITLLVYSTDPAPGLRFSSSPEMPLMQPNQRVSHSRSSVKALIMEHSLPSPAAVGQP